MQKIYTAVGRFETRKAGFGKEHPVVMIHKTEHELEINEMIIWSALNWRVLNMAHIERLYNRRLFETKTHTGMDFEIYFDFFLLRIKTATLPKTTTPIMSATTGKVGNPLPESPERVILSFDGAFSCVSSTLF